MDKIKFGFKQLQWVKYIGQNTSRNDKIILGPKTSGHMLRQNIFGQSRPIIRTKIPGPKHLGQNVLGQNMVTDKILWGHIINSENEIGPNHFRHVTLEKITLGEVLFSHWIVCGKFDLWYNDILFHSYFVIDSFE